MQSATQLKISVQPARVQSEQLSSHSKKRKSQYCWLSPSFRTAWSRHASKFGGGLSGQSQGVSDPPCGITLLPPSVATATPGPGPGPGAGPPPPAPPSQHCLSQGCVLKW